MPHQKAHRTPPATAAPTAAPAPDDHADTTSDPHRLAAVIATSAIARPSQAKRPAGYATDGAFRMGQTGVVRQIRRNTSVPLVPPKPKLFFSATSIFTSRATLAQ